MQRLTVTRALDALDGAGTTYADLFRRGALEVGVYRPRGTDPQQPHDRDELYVVASGRGFFRQGAARQPFEAGEVLFVPAGEEHRFEDFSDDFAAWVFFFGPAGGAGEA